MGVYFNNVNYTAWTTIIKSNSDTMETTYNRRAKSFLHPKICKSWRVVKKMLSCYDFVSIRWPWLEPVKSGDKNPRVFDGLFCVCLSVFFIFCFSFWFPVFKDEEYGRQREINRRNSDSVVYIKPKENEAAAVPSSLKTAEIKFQQEKIETLESRIDRISKVYREQEERDLEIHQLAHVADQPDDGMK